MKQVTEQCCIDVHPACASLSHDRSAQGNASSSHERRDKAKYSFSFFFGDWNLAFDGVVRMFSYDSRGQPLATLRASIDSSVYLCCLLTSCHNVRMGHACRSGRQRRREDCAAPFCQQSTRTAMWSLEAEMFHDLPIPRTESRCRASQECCSMTRKLVDPTHNA